MANSSKEKIVSISVFTLFLIGLFVIFFCISVVIKPDKAPIKEEASHHKSSAGISGGAGIGIEDFSFTEYAQTDNGVEKSFVISGRKAQTKNPKIGIFRVAIGKVMELEKPEITFYKDDQPISIASSKTGVMNSLDKSVDFYGNVGLVTKDRRTLACDSLKWSNEQKYLLAEGNCVLRAEGKAIKAEMLKTDTALRNFSVVSKNRDFLKTVTKLFSEGGRK